MPALKRPTQAEIAKEAQVSQSAVSFVLNGKFSDRIPAATREKVLRAARRLGYRQNYYARSLALGKANCIGLVYEESFDFLTGDPFVSGVFNGITRELNRRRQNLIFSALEPGSQDLPPMLESYFVEGVLLPACKNPKLPALLRNRGIPHLLVDPFYREEESPCLLIDNETGVFGAVDHLIRKGHRRIAMVAPRHRSGKVAWSFEERIAGYRRALEEHSIAFDPSLLVLSEYESLHPGKQPDFTAGFHAGMKLLDRAAGRPTAVLAANDQAASGILSASQRLEIRVPEELSIVGFDDLPSSRTSRPALTTVRVDKEALGRRAVSLLLDLIQGKPAARAARAPAELVLRASAAKPATHPSSQRI